MWGQGERRKCPECGQDIRHLADNSLSRRELRGPRNITASNVDRILDDGGRRFLIIEEKRDKEQVPKGQHSLLTALAKLPLFDVWLAKGNQDCLTIEDFNPQADPFPFIQDGSWDDYQGAVDAWFARKAQRQAS